MPISKYENLGTSMEPMSDGKVSFGKAMDSIVLPTYGARLLMFNRELV